MFGLCNYTKYGKEGNKASKQAKSNLRAVLTIVTAHTFCASRDTQVFLLVMLTNTVIFLLGLKLSVESRSL